MNTEYVPLSTQLLAGTFFFLNAGKGKKKKKAHNRVFTQMSESISTKVILQQGTSHSLLFNNTAQHCGIVTHGGNSEAGFSQSTSRVRPYSVPVLRKPALQLRTAWQTQHQSPRAGRRGARGEKKSHESAGDGRRRSRTGDKTG